jgi:hypothetical protein
METKFGTRTTGWMALLIALAATVASFGAFGQELVVSTATELAPGPLIAIADLAAELPAPVLFYIAPPGFGTLPGVNPHGFDLLDRDTAIASHVMENEIDVVDLPTATITARLTPNNSYNGFGTVAINPARTHVLVAGGSVVFGEGPRLNVFAMPLDDGATPFATFMLPGDVSTYQTHAIAFDATSGRAFVGHTNGITAIDPPYTSANVAFTIALPASTGSYAVDLAPDRSLIAASHGPTAAVTLVHAPFSATSAFENIPIDGAQSPDGLVFVPDGSRLLVTESEGNDAGGARIYAIAAPFSSVSIVETLTMPTGVSRNGFEDIAVSPDGNFAALAGQGTTDDDPLVVLRAPFTAAGFTTYALPLARLAAPYGTLSARGAGTAHFWATAAPAFAPEIFIDRISTTEGNAGTHDVAFTLSTTRASATPISIDYATHDGTAHAGVDYVATSGTLTLPAGARSATISVGVNGDTEANGDRTFRLLLNAATGGAIILQGTLNGTCTIVDDDSVTPYIANDSPLPDATVGVPYEVQFTVGNDAGTATWSVSSAGDLFDYGLFFDGATGTLSGVPTHATTEPLYFEVTYLGFPFNATREYELNVRDDTIFADGFDD